jgi:hypothetical protein
VIGSAYQQNVQDLSGPISKRVEIFNLGKENRPEYESTWRKAEIKHEREEVAAAAKAKITGERVCAVFVAFHFGYGGWRELLFK